MDDLVTWLRAQLDDDERVARQLNAAPGGVYLEPETSDVNTMNLGAYLMRWPPKRVLAEVDAKRCILDNCRGEVGGRVLKLLALPYAGRDGYRAEWRP